MLKTYQFKTQCKGDIHSSKTANIILQGLTSEYRWSPLRVQNRIQVQMHPWCWLKQLLSQSLNELLRYFNCSPLLLSWPAPQNRCSQTEGGAVPDYTAWSQLCMCMNNNHTDFTVITANVQAAVWGVRFRK